MSVKQKPKRVLACIAALFIASGIVRLATGMGPAIAYAEGQMAQAPVAAKPVETAALDLDPLVAALQARERRITDRESAIDDRMRALAAAEEEVGKRLAELQAAEDSLLAALATSETANDDDIARLTAVYENMKPADAAGLFETMAPDFASGFLVRMRPEAAAAIMTGLEPQTAYSISAIIAGRNANAPTQ